MRPSAETRRSGVQKLLDRLSSWQLIALLGALFVADLAIPDIVPFVDEIFLGMSTLLLARWRLRRNQEEPQKPPPKNVTPGR